MKFVTSLMTFTVFFATSLFASTKIKMESGTELDIEAGDDVTIVCGEKPNEISSTATSSENEIIKRLLSELDAKKKLRKKLEKVRVEEETEEETEESSSWWSSKPSSYYGYSS